VRICKLHLDYDFLFVKNQKQIFQGKNFISFDFSISSSANNQQKRQIYIAQHKISFIENREIKKYILQKSQLNLTLKIITSQLAPFSEAFV